MSRIDELRLEVIAEAQRAHDALVTARAAYAAEEDAYAQARDACIALKVAEAEVPGYEPKAPRAKTGERADRILAFLKEKGSPASSKEIVALFGEDAKLQSAGRTTMYQLEKKGLLAKTEAGYVLSSGTTAKKRGRKPKAAGAPAVEGAVKLNKDGSVAKKRGRKPKSETAVAAAAPAVEGAVTEAAPAVAKKPGRPRKEVAAAEPLPTVEIPTGLPEAPVKDVSF